MSQQIINNGTVAGDATGESLFNAWTKANANFTELYTGLGGLIAKSGASAALTGTTTETALATIVIPANTIGANGILRVTTFWTMTSSANTKTIRTRLGGSGIGGTVILTTAPTTIDHARIMTELTAANATNSQFTQSNYPRGNDSLIWNGSNTTSAVDMTAAQNLVISAQLANTGETITLLGYVVEAMK